MIKVLQTKAVLLEYGPMRVVISALDGGIPLVDLAKEGAQFGMQIFRDMAHLLPVIKKKAADIREGEIYPGVIQKMIESTKAMHESDLTPLAAVAGTISDMIADFIFDRGGKKVIVDNGGDLAIRLKDGESVRVGVKTEIDATQPSYVIAIDSSMEIGGVATSGLGGRSFTKGIASAVTVLAKNGSLADAAATVIGNYTNVEDCNIKRTLAENIYADTDIIGEWVTISVGELSNEKIEEALNNGLLKANSINQKRLIMGALITVKGRTRMDSFVKTIIHKTDYAAH